jgi:alkylhydroperoxidase family enzyme
MNAPNSWIPRFDIETMPTALNRYLEPRVKRLGYLGEMFQVGANAPDVLLTFMHFTDALKEAVDFDISETIVLTVAVMMSNRYELHQHERLSIRNGFDRMWIAEVEALAPDKAQVMTYEQLCAQRYAIALIRTHGSQVKDEFEAMSAHFTPAQAMSIAFLIGRYITHALIVNTLDLCPPVPSVFEDDFSP